MAQLVLNVDGYGSRGQLSLVADFVEFYCTVQARKIGHQDIARFLEQRGLRIRLFQFVPLAGPSSEAHAEELEDDASVNDHASKVDVKSRHASDDAQRVLALLKERSVALGREYPFAIDAAGSLHRRHKTALAYDVALSFALRHACLGDASAALDFEGFVERCLEAQGYRVFPLSARVRSAPGIGATRFSGVFRDFASRMSVVPTNDANVPEQIHDGGVDVVARWEPADDRAGCRTLVVQATVGKAETWYAKAFDPKIGMWRKLLGDPLTPLVTLAVPHHVEDTYLHELVDNWEGRTVFDRLRLVAHRPRVTKDDRASVRALQRAGVEW